MYLLPEKANITYGQISHPFCFLTGETSEKRCREERLSEVPMISNFNGVSNVSRTEEYIAPSFRNINLRGTSRPGDDEMDVGSLKFCVIA
jgi:hypothetical protein